MVNCSNCGIDVGDKKFCPECGTKVEMEEKPKNICPNCGADVGKSKFCPECGTKIETEKQDNICPNCGADVGTSKFCPECGTKIAGEKQSKKTCPNCGKEIKPDAKFCPYCGWSESKDEPKTISDKILDADKSFSSKIGSRLSRSKTMDSVLDKTVSMKTKHLGNVSDNAVNRKYYEKIEPAFLEVFDSIEDGYLKDLFMVVRGKYDVKGGVAGVVVSSVDTPTKGMSYNNAVKFYVDMLNDLKNEINHEKQNGTFDEEAFYKKKVKENAFNNLSVTPVLKALKSRKK